eukprot:gene9174-10873_t
MVLRNRVIENRDRTFHSSADERSSSSAFLSLSNCSSEDDEDGSEREGSRSERSEETPSPKGKAEFSSWEDVTRLKELKDEGLLDAPELKKYKRKLLDRLTSKPAENLDSESSKRRGSLFPRERDRPSSSDESLEEISPSKALSKKGKSRASTKTRPKDEDVVWEDIPLHETRESAKDDGIEAAFADHYVYIYGGPRGGGVYGCADHVECPAKMIYNQLRLKYKKDKKKFKLIPDCRMIENRKRRHTRVRLGDIKFENPADLTEFTAAHLLPSDKEEALKLPKDQLVILPGGVFSLEDGHGSTFSTLALLQNVVSARKAWGSSIRAETEGTYKL